jgi:hypothetical protein
MDGSHEMTELIRRSVAAEPEAASELWWSVSERVLERLRLAIGVFAAERATSHLRGRLLAELPAYDPAQQPFGAWLDVVVDRYCAERIPG